MCVPELLAAETRARKDLKGALSPPDIHERSKLVRMSPVLQVWVVLLCKVCHRRAMPWLRNMSDSGKAAGVKVCIFLSVKAYSADRRRHNKTAGDICFVPKCDSTAECLLCPHDLHPQRGAGTSCCAKPVDSGSIAAIQVLLLIRVQPNGPRKQLRTCRDETQGQRAHRNKTEQKQEQLKLCT